MTGGIPRIPIIAVINDDPTQLCLLSEFLRSAGFATMPFAGADAALQTLEPACPPALIITDLYMPGSDGWRLCRLLRSSEYAAFNAVPVMVVFATFAGDEAARIAADLGVDAFLPLPIKRDVFIEQVTTILRGQHRPLPPRVLIVEDSRHLAAALHTAFAAEGYSADTAGTVREAGEAFAAQVYDAVILDYHLPDGFGDMLIERFRNERPDCVCIMMTTDPSPGLAMDWLNKGASAYVRKPFDPSYLLTLCAQTRRERSLLRSEDLLEQRTRELQESERKYRELVENAGSIILRMDAQCRVMFMNEFGCKFFGFSENEILGRPVLGTIVPPTDSSGRDLAAMFDELSRHPEAFARNENENMRRSGERVWISWTNRPIVDEDGSLREILCVGNDITEHRLAQERLREESERLEHILNITGTRIDIVDRDFNLHYVDQGWQKVYGHPDGRKCYEYFMGLGEPCAGCGIPRALETKEVVVTEERLPRENNRFVEVHTIPFLDSTGQWLVAEFNLDINERKQAEEYQRQSREMISAILGSIEDAVMSYSAVEGRYVFVGLAFEKIFGRTIAECSTSSYQWMAYIHPEDIEEIFGCVWDSLDRHGFFDQQVRIIRADGTIRWVHIRMKAITDASGMLERMDFVISDSTARKHAELEQEKLRSSLVQAQKMESVGQLAGGVAHDFNNMLGAILAYTELALENVQPGQQLYSDLNDIRKVALRSADLTRQLLAFARKQTIDPQILDVNKAVEGTLSMLRPLIGEDIELAWAPGSSLEYLRIDPSQIDQILTNVCVNARDAVERGGRIVIETAMETLDEAYCAERPGFVPGTYVKLAVSDNGCGMDAEELSKIFDPFFTTKEMGRGTGLGMATVYGIVKQNNGFINVDSRPGCGTRISMYFPGHAPAAEQHCRPAAAGKIGACGTEMILLVEDEPSNLIVTRRMLEKFGYRVLAASGPSEALRLARTHAGRIDLLLTDVVMPEMNGRELADAVLAVRPDTLCLFMSGYPADAVVRHGVLNVGVHFLSKPFVGNDLAMRIRHMLDNCGASWTKREYPGCIAGRF